MWRWGGLSVNLGGWNELGSSFYEVLGSMQSGSFSFVRGYKMSLFLGWG